MLMRQLHVTRRRLGDRTIVIVLVSLGIALRAAWSALRPQPSAAGEALNVALAIGSGRGIADAYGTGTGPTAHFYPLTQAIGGGVYSVLGLRTLAAEFVLTTWSIALVMASFLLLIRIFGRLGTNITARLGALAFACLSPLYLGQEAVDFRLWDGGVTIILMVLLLDQLLHAEMIAARDDPRQGRNAVAIGVCAAMLLVVNPPAGMAGGVASLVLMIRRMSIKQMLLSAAAGIVVLAAMLTPWVIRNEQVFGTFIPSRSNAGLELRIGMDSASLTAPDRRERFMELLSEIHPTWPKGFAALEAAGGEVAYSHRLGSETTQWMVTHPKQTAQLLLLHLRQQWIPEPWQFATFGTGTMPGPRALLCSAVNALGLLGLALALWRHRPGWLYLAILLFGLSALTLPFQPVMRYTYLYYPFMIFAAADLIATAWRAWQTRAPRRSS
ncbi:MAG: hypothetical protein PGN16_18635 [Sphingomonas phyllosphaerae]|uniref:hypothetical protein n=1 Tax=Sphingomonas phyllosphaerae TaxID=257003 RepID=UPI002FFA71EA